MSRHYEKGIARAQETAASAGKKPEETDPWTSQRIESFAKGFGLSAAAVKQIVAAWTADQRRAYDHGWESGADAGYYCTW